jgi:hypothetical protein
MATDSSALDQQPSVPRSTRRIDVVGTVVLRALPFAFALAAYLLVGTAKADLTSIQNLIQLAIGLVAGVATYTVITEVTLLRLPRRLSKELDVLVDELAPLKTTVANMTNAIADLSTAVDSQLRALLDLHEMEILYDQQDALARARALQDSAGQSIEAMWTNLPYDEALQKYFSETLSEGPFACRIVAARSVDRADLLDHVDKMWDRLAAQTYEIYLTHDCNYEALVVDHSIAALFIYSDKGFGSCFLSSPGQKFVNAVEGLIAGLKRPEWRLPVQRNDTKDLAKIDDWLDNYYQSLP